MRAAGLAGLKTVPCVLREPDEATAARLRLIENFIREDLNAIEEALSFRELTTQHGITQRQLAEELSVSQSHIANRIRLLDLPDDWQQRIISQEIPPTHARYLLPWAKYPRVLEAVGTDLETERMTVEDFQGCIEDAVLQCSRSVYNPPFKMTPKRKQECDVIEFEGLYGRKWKRAMNVEAFDRLTEEAQAAQRSKAMRAPDESEDGDADGTAAKKQTAAEKKANAEKQKKQAQKRLWMYRLEWQRRRVVETIRGLDPVEHEADRLTVLQLMAFFIVNNGVQSLGDAFETIGDQHKHTAAGSQRSEWKSLVRLDDGQVLRIGQALAAEAVEESNLFSYHATVKEDGIEELWLSLGITFDSWRLDDDFLGLWTKADLVKLAGEWKLGRNGEWSAAVAKGKRGDLVEALRKIDAATPLPATKALKSVTKPAGVYFC